MGVMKQGFTADLADCEVRSKSAIGSQEETPTNSGNIVDTLVSLNTFHVTPLVLSACGLFSCVRGLR